MASVDPRTWATTIPVDARMAILELVERNPPTAALEALTVCAKLLANVAADPIKYGVLKSSSKALQERLLSREGGEAALVALGFDADVAAGVFSWSSDAPASTIALQAGAIQAAHSICDAVREAIVSVGDTNTPTQAQGAVSLLCTYVGNVLMGGEEAPGFRRIGAANKSLCGRLLAASGGPNLLRASGFVPEPLTGPIAFVCAADVPTLRLVLGMLSRAGEIWGALAVAAAATTTAAAASAAAQPNRQESTAPGAMEGVCRCAA